MQGLPTGKEIIAYGNGHDAKRVLSLEPFEIGSNNRQEGGGLTEALSLLRNRYWVILLVALAGAIAGGFLTFEQTPIYQAQTSIQIQAPPETYLGLSSSVGSGTTGPEFYLQTQIKVLQSKSLRTRVIEALKAKNELTYTEPNRVSVWRSALGLPAQKLPGTVHRGLPPIQVVVHGFEGTQVVEISCDSPDPVFSARFVNHMADEYMKASVESRWDASVRTAEWLSRQLDDVKHRVESSERELQAYSSMEGLILTDDKDSIDQGRLKDIQAELAKAQAERVSAQSAFEVATSSSVDTVPQVIDNERLSTYQSKLAELRREYAEATSLYTPEHYKVERLKAQIEELQGTLERERKAVVGRIQNDYQAALRRERLLTTAYEGQLNLVSETSAKMIKYDLLKREVDTNRQLYGALLQKVKETSVASAMSASNIGVLDAGMPAPLPYKPTILSNILKGVVSGLLLGVILIIASDRINGSLRAPGEASYHLRIPELGVIPASESVAGRDGLSAFKNSRVLTIEEKERAEEGGEEEQRVELVAWQNSPSVLAESYRNVLTSIMLSGGRRKVMVVTSAARQEGKTTIVSNLGIVLAEIGQKVLLIDADMRKPRLHDVFNCSNSWGLSDVLREKNVLKDCPLSALARSTHIPNLSVLPSGPGALSISSLLYSGRMTELLDRVRLEFDTVLVDTPPILHLSDARVLAKSADAAILVVRAGHTTREIASIVKRRLEEDGITLLGTILNRWNLRAKTRYGNYNYYSSYEDSE